MFTFWYTIFSSMVDIEFSWYKVQSKRGELQGWHIMVASDSQSEWEL